MRYASTAVELCFVAVVVLCILVLYYCSDRRMLIFAGAGCVWAGFRTGGAYVFGRFARPSLARTVCSYVRGSRPSCRYKHGSNDLTVTAVGGPTTSRRAGAGRAISYPMRQMFLCCVFGRFFTQGGQDCCSVVPYIDCGLCANWVRSCSDRCVFCLCRWRYVFVVAYCCGATAADNARNGYSSSTVVV